MNLKQEIEFSRADILQQVDALKQQIDDMRPLPTDVEGRVIQKLRLDWNYNSNAIEGNKLDYGETVAFLMTGITAKGKPLKDHLDIRGHNEAILFLTSMVKDKRPLSEMDIRSLHEMILVESYEVKAQTPDGNVTSKRISLGKYKTAPNHVITVTGEPHYYASPEETEGKMHELIDWYHAASATKEIHPVVIAALFHHRFVAIHPFDDGNGRLARIIMNLALMRNDFPPVVIKQGDKQNYYALLSQADSGNDAPFIEYIAERLKNSLELYVKAANGQDISESDDIDKNIELFKTELLGRTDLKEKRSNDLIEKILKDQIEPLFNKIESKVKKFEDLFFEKKYVIEFDSDDIFDPSHNTISDFLAEGPSYKKKILDYSKFIVLIFQLKKFKNLENNFSVDAQLKISLDEYHYRFIDLTSKITTLSKLYHEAPSIKEEDLIIKSLIESLMLSISEKVKGSESE